MKMRFFRLAKKLSKKSNHPQHRLGCIIVRKGEELGGGFNINRTHPKSMTDFRMLHAEVSAVVNAGEEDLTGAVVYVYRETNGGAIAASRPCKGCEALLRSLGVKTVHYTTTNGYATDYYD